MEWNENGKVEVSKSGRVVEARIELSNQDKYDQFAKKLFIQNAA